MATALDLITLALKNAGVNGVGQAPTAEDTQDCLLALNGMLAQWAVKRYLVFHLLDVSVQSTGASSYSIGEGQTFNCARPDRLEGAFLRFNPNSANTVDFPLTIIQSREDYNAIALKNMAGVAASVFLDSGYPYGTLYFWPLPTAFYELHVTVKAPLAAITDLTAELSLPGEYFEALLYNLSTRLASMYQLPIRPDVVALAKASLATIRGANTQIPTLRMPYNLYQRRGMGVGVVSTGFDYVASSGVLESGTVGGLPTTLPSTPGVLWNNGGVLCVS